MTEAHKPSEPHEDQAPRHRRSIHEGIEACDDPVCCCEPEPRWQALAEELQAAQPGSGADQSSHRNP